MGSDHKVYVDMYTESPSMAAVSEPQDTYYTEDIRLCPVGLDP